jgi:adenylate cyclase
VTGERVERRLAAILAADVAGYSRLMGADEVGTLATLKSIRREVVDPAIANHKGRIVKTTGDGMLVEFGSAVGALTCAIAVQEKMAERNDDIAPKIAFRIGINVGDIIIDGDDIFGDGVNIAARVESECEPSGVCLSDDAFRQVRGKTAFAFDDLRERSLKNIDRPVRLYSVRTATSTSGKVPAERTKPLTLPDKPSIAVLPFTNMSGDPDQEYFADGMVEDIITALSRFKSLFVIARNSSFTYKGRAVDIKQVGRELGVRYVLEGSVRKAGGRLRITGQLIDAMTGAHLWADKFDGELNEVFDLQDTVATGVVGAVAPKLIAADVERAKRKPLDSWDSYDFYLRGLALLAQRTAETTDQALKLFRKSIDLDPEFGLAHIRVAACYYMRPVHGGLPLTEEERSETVHLTARAISLAGDDELVLAWAALVFGYLNDEIERGVDLADRALAINPNLSAAWNARGWLSTGLHDCERALDCFDRAVRLSPADDWIVLNALRGKGCALFLLDRHGDALEIARRLLARHPSDLYGWFFQLVLGDRTMDAAGRIRALYPQLRNPQVKQMFLN